MKVIWYLFDSGNSCGKQAYNIWDKRNGYTYISIGLDRENKNNDFVNCDLSNTDCFDTLDKLPKPDIILASPPCESFSLASAVKGGGNINFDKDLVPRSKEWYKNYLYMGKIKLNAEYQMNKAKMGIKCANNLIEIVSRYRPRFYLIENPRTSLIWLYLTTLNYQFIDDTNFIKNNTEYGAYGYNIRKRTTFAGNVKLNLKKCDKNWLPEYQLKYKSKLQHNAKTVMNWTYNERSNIPLLLLLDIYNQLDSKFIKENK